MRQRADRRGSIGSPKSDAGKRSVPLAPMVVSTLREWRLACPKGPHDLVFPNGKGRSGTDNRDPLSRALAPLQHAAGISDTAKPKYGMHSLRHAAASLFIEQGFSPKRVQALMGHSSIQVTFDTYGHLFPAAEDDRLAMSGYRRGSSDSKKPRPRRVRLTVKNGSVTVSAGGRAASPPGVRNP